MIKLILVELEMDWHRAAKGFAVVLLRALLLCDIMFLLNIALVSLFLFDAESAIYLYFVSLLFSLEGGFGLVIGGLMVVAAGPTWSKASQTLFHGEPYTTKRYHERERDARWLFLVSVMLLAIGLLMPV
jgi:hypothetical protein